MSQVAVRVLLQDKEKPSTPFHFFEATLGSRDIYYCHVAFGFATVDHGTRFVLVAGLVSRSVLGQLHDLAAAGQVRDFPAAYMGYTSPEMTVTLK